MKFDVNSFYFTEFNFTIKNPLIAPIGISISIGVIIKVVNRPRAETSVKAIEMIRSHLIAAPKKMLIGCNCVLSVVLNWLLLGIIIHRPRYIKKGTNNSQEVITNVNLFIQR